MVGTIRSYGGSSTGRLVAMVATLLVLLVVGISAPTTFPAGISNAHAGYRIHVDEFQHRGVADAVKFCKTKQFAFGNRTFTQLYVCLQNWTRVDCVVGGLLPTNVGLCSYWFVEKAIVATHNDLVCDGSLFYKKTASGIRRMHTSNMDCRHLKKPFNPPG